LVECVSQTTSFELTMSKGAHDVFDWLWISWEKIRYWNKL
jgi:hypothetical protein